MRRRSLLFGTTLALMAMTLGTPKVMAQESSESFFSGRDVTIHITGSLGGVNGTYTTLLAEFMKRHVPGNPNFMVVPMDGAGGARSLNYMAEAAPKDGSILLMPPWEALLFEMFGTESVQYESMKYNWLGRITDVTSVLIVSDKSGVTSLETAAGVDLIAGSQGPQDHFALSAMLANRLAGTNIRVVLGYDGMPSMMLAMEQDEINAFAPTWATLAVRADDLKAGKVLPVLSISRERRADFPEVPALAEFVKEENDQAFLDIYMSQQVIGRALIAPPGVPEDRVEALRAGFEATMKDPDFITALKERGLDLNPMFGAALQEEIQRVSNTDPTLIESAREIYVDLIEQVENRG